MTSWLSWGDLIIAERYKYKACEFLVSLHHWYYALSNINTGPNCATRFVGCVVGGEVKGGPTIKIVAL